MNMYSENLRRIIVCGIVFLMLGICGMISSASLNAEEDGDEETLDECKKTRSVDSRGTEIANYLRLCSTSWGSSSDGNYGPENGYYFYLNSVHNNFRIYLMNIDTKNNYFRYVNTTLMSGSTPTNIIKIKSPYYNQTNMDYYEVDSFFYDLEIGKNAPITTYQLIVNVKFVVIDTNWNAVQRSGSININLILSSRLTTSGGGSELELKAIDRFGSIEPLYSGTRDQLITLPSVSSASGDLYDVGFTLNLPNSFKFQSDVANLEEIRTSSNYKPLWRLTDAGAISAKPEDVSGTIDVTYTHNDIMISEEEVSTIIEIKNTPIIGLTDQIAESEIGSTSGDTFVSNLEIYQGTISELFPLEFKNVGNLDLKDVEVELFTDNAVYFFKSDFYYDENDFSDKQAYGKTISLGNLNIGATVTRHFSTEVIKNLPPGLFKIPIKYKAKYAQDLIDLDLDVNDYHDDIIAARADNNKGFNPFILVQVKEGDDENDFNEPDLTATSTTFLEPGMRDVQLAVELSNLENYQLNNVNAKIDAGGPSPLQVINEMNRTFRRINNQEIDLTMYAANDYAHSNKVTIHFFVDVYSGAASGVQYVSITVTCFDPFNQERTTIVMVPLNIHPVPPEFVIIDSSTSDIYPNENFTLKVKVYNCGGCTAKNVYMMFNGSSNLLSVENSIQGPILIPGSDEAEFEFEVRAGEVEPKGNLQTSVLLSYEDESGNFYPFDSSSALTIPLFVKEPIILQPRFMLTDVSSGDIRANANFTLQVKIYNVGDATAKNVWLMFNGSSNLFSAVNSVVGPRNIMIKEEAMYEFSIKAGDVEMGKIYKSNILISYEDPNGNVYNFDEIPSFPVEFQAKYEEPEVITIVKKEKAETWQIDQGIAIVLLGLLLLVSVVAFNAQRSRTGKKEMAKTTEGEFENGRISQEKPTATTEKRKGSRFGRKKGEVIDMTKPGYSQQQYPTQDSQANTGQTQTTYQSGPTQEYLPPQDYTSQAQAQQTQPSQSLVVPEQQQSVTTTPVSAPSYGPDQVY